jgi:hypothetical protein
MVLFTLGARDVEPVRPGWTFADVRLDGFTVAVDIFFRR